MKLVPMCEFCGRFDFLNEDECKEHEKVCPNNPNSEIFTAIYYIDPYDENPQSNWHCPNCNAYAFKRYGICISCHCKLTFPEESEEV